MDATYNLSGGFKPTIKRFADLDGPDFFPTPAWATYALIDNEKFSGEIWESACGDGAMSRVLAQTGCNVLSSDLHNRGYGDVGIDFLTARRNSDNIVTNPPYNSAEGFVAAGVQKTTRKFALLLRLAFLEGANRANTIFSRNPPNRVWVFSERITFYPPALFKGEQGQPLMLGSCGTRKRAVLSLSGSNLAIKPVIHDSVKSAQTDALLPSP
jgi:hypothetical protein